MRNALLRRKNGSLYPILRGIISIVFCGILTGSFSPGVTNAYAQAPHIQYQGLSNCSPAADPTSQSLLIVLLDRSGSLDEGPSPTDPDGYSTSVTKALADLWPGNMAVIPFTGDTTQLPVFGPATLSDPTQRADLKDKVQQYPIGGDTPLDPAMREALTLLHQRGNPAGSRVILITDGNPTGIGNNDGPHQEQDIRANLIKQYCAQSLPIDAFGLKIDSSTSDGQDANRLLSDITKGTGGTYTNVRSPEELAQTVISLYAQWQHLNFTQEKERNGNFAVSIDSFAQQVNIVAFRSNDSYTITLSDPGGHPVTQGMQQSTDRHYLIDSLDVSGPIVAGTYTVNAGGDPDIQVYVLVSSPLQVQLISPTAQTKAYTGSPIQIQAQFLNGHDVLTPQSGQAQIVAHVTLLIDGRPGGASNDVVLTQQGALFAGQTLSYQQLGTVRIELLGTYQQVKRETSFALQLLKQPLPPPPPCHKGFLQCLWEEHPTQVLIGGPILLLLLAFLLVLLLWLPQPPPTGWLRGRTNNRDQVPLREVNSFMGKLIHKSVIYSSDIGKHPGAGASLKFGVTTSFRILFKRGGKTYIRLSNDNTSRVSLKKGNQETLLDKNHPEKELSIGSMLVINGNDKASYESGPRPKQ